MRRAEEQARLRAELDGLTAGLRVAGVRAAPPEGWLRAMRRAIGMPVMEVARRAQMTRHGVYKLEAAEKAGRIRLGTLRKAAQALGCELVYAFVPKDGSLEARFAREKEAREQSPEWQRQTRERFAATLAKAGIQVKEQR